MEELHFSTINSHRINSVRQSEIQTAERLAPEPSSSDTDIVTEMLKNHKSPSTDKILVETTQADVNINKFISVIWNKEEMAQHWKKSITVPNYKKGDDLKQGDALSPLLFNLSLEHAIRKVQEKEERLEFNL